MVLPHERTHADSKEGRLRLLRATRTQLEPIFLLHDGDPVELPDREPDLALGGERLWRIDALPGDLASSSSSPTATTATRRRSRSTPRTAPRLAPG